MFQEEPRTPGVKQNQQRQQSQALGHLEDVDNDNDHAAFAYLLDVKNFDDLPDDKVLHGVFITHENFCLVCKRKFADTQKLERHCQLSDLHKTNIRLLRAEKVVELKKKASILKVLLISNFRI